MLAPTAQGGHVPQIYSALIVRRHLFMSTVGDAPEIPAA